MILKILKTATQSKHSITENKANADKIMQGTLQIEEYKNLLLATYIFHEQIEKQLAKIPAIVLYQGLNFGARQKTQALKQDIENLGITANVSQAMPNTIKIQTLEQGLGAMYVMEGATLGGAIIFRELQKNKNLQNYSNAMHYYQIYGENTGKNWKEFCSILQEVAKTPTQIDQIVETANKTFDAYIQCLNYLQTKQNFR
jgi:heme oxygenase